MTRNDGGPAYPTYDSRGDGVGDEGMPLRDWFAGQAMKSLLLLGTDRPTEKKSPTGAEFDWPDSVFYFGEWDPMEDQCVGVDLLASDAYQVADAMLKAREGNS